MSVKFHVNSNGEPGKCHAQSNNCPFGDENNHYDSMNAARTAYEKTNTGNQIPKKIRFPRIEILFPYGIDIEPQHLKVMIKNEMPFKASAGSARRIQDTVSIIYSIKEQINSNVIEKELRKIISPHSNYFEIIIR